MDTGKIKAKKTKIIAHRGLSGLECENTGAAFVAAGNRNYFGIETDVHVSADGKLVIIHDDNTNRVSGVDYVVEKTCYEQLRQLRLFDVGTQTPRRDLLIPLLSDYVGICKKYEKTAVLELKNPMERNAVRDIIEAIRREDYLEQTVFISFSWENLVLVREFLPQQAVQFLTDKIDDALIERLKQAKFDLDIYYPRLSRRWVRRLHKNGILVNCWTCDKEHDAKKLISWKVDFLTTNRLQGR